MFLHIQFQIESNASLSEKSSALDVHVMQKNLFRFHIFFFELNFGTYYIFCIMSLSTHKCTASSKVFLCGVVTEDTFYPVKLY